MRKLSRIEKIKERSWRKNYALREVVADTTRKLGHEKGRADRLVEEAGHHAAVMADKNNHIGRLNAQVLQKDVRIAELVSERERITKLVGQFLSVQILTADIKTTKELRLL